MTLLVMVHSYHVVKVRHVSRLLATQLTSAGLGPGVLVAEEQRLRDRAKEDMEEVRGIAQLLSNIYRHQCYF